MLPFLLSALGSAAAGAGILGGLSPLIAGALGSGLGSYMQTGDLGDGIKSGLGSFALGGLFGGGVNALKGSVSPAALNAAAMPSGAQAIVPSLGPMAAPASSGIKGLLSDMPSGMVANSYGPEMAVGSLTKNAITNGALSKAGIGGMLGAHLTTPESYTSPPEDKERTQNTPLNRAYIPAPAGYRPGIDPEHTYFNPVNPYYGRPSYTPMRTGGVVTSKAPIRMAEGGLTDMGSKEVGKINDKQVVSTAIAAIRGELPEEESKMALAMFLRAYGEDELRGLVDKVYGGDPVVPDNIGKDMAGGGMVRGGGHGMNDMVSAQGPAGSQYQLSSGEYIVPADVVSGLGNGSTDAGAKELRRMQSRVRNTRTGSTRQAPSIKATATLPA